MNGIYTVKFGVRTLSLKYTFRAVKALEKKLDAKVTQFDKRLKSMGMEEIEALVHCGLIWKNKEITADEVADIIDEAAEHGKLNELMQAASDALAYFFGGDEAKNAKRAKARK